MNDIECLMNLRWFRPGTLGARKRGTEDSCCPCRQSILARHTGSWCEFHRCIRSHRPAVRRLHACSVGSWYVQKFITVHSDWISLSIKFKRSAYTLQRGSEHGGEQGTQNKGFRVHFCSFDREKNKKLKNLIKKSLKWTRFKHPFAQTVLWQAFGQVKWIWMIKNMNWKQINDQRWRENVKEQNVFVITKSAYISIENFFPCLENKSEIHKFNLMRSRPENQNDIRALRNPDKLRQVRN